MTASPSPEFADRTGAPRASGRLRVAIVGAGPRGLIMTERLVGKAARDGRPLAVHLVDPHPAGAGSIWRTRQSRALWMNTVASQVTVFVDATVPGADPLPDAVSLHEWAQLVVTGRAPGPEWVREACSSLGPDDYPTRALMGAYLEWALEEIRRRTPAHVSLTTCPVRAQALATDGDAHMVSLSDGSELVVDAVVLAQGHLPVAPTALERTLEAEARHLCLRYVRSGNPADAPYASLPARERVAVRGLGLAFFDWLSLLTVGRGGRFAEDARGGLRYEPSGEEPQIVAGSRRGVPLHARGRNQKGATGRHPPIVLTPDRIDELRARHRRRGDLAFRRDVWPLVAAEMELVYYQRLLGWSRSRVEALGSVWPELADAERDELLAGCAVTEADRWRWSKVADPCADAPRSYPAFQAWLRDWLLDDVAAADRGNVADPLKSALDALRDLRNEIRLVIDHGGITGESYRREVQGEFNAFCAYLSIGPPAHRVRELVALLDAGIVAILGPGFDVRPDYAARAWLPFSALRDVPALPARALVEARLHDIDVRRTADPLVRGLLENGMASPFRIPNERGRSTAVGGLCVTPPPARLVSALGSSHAACYVVGVPTEGVHWMTAAGARPGVGSVTFSEAEAIADAILGPPRAAGAGRREAAGVITGTRTGSFV